MLTRAPRKREGDDGDGKPNLAQPPEKKSKLPERRFRKRRLQEVLNELCYRVQSNDRQLTNNLIRELDTEHVRVISGRDFERSCMKMLKAALTAKIDSVSTKMFACLVSMFSRGSLERRKNFIKSLHEICEGLAKATKEAAKINAIIVTSRQDTPARTGAPSTSTKTPEAPKPSEDGSESDSSVDELPLKKPENPFRVEKIAPSRSGLEEEMEEISMIDAFYQKPNLDCGVLGLYTMALREGIVETVDIPEKVRLIARRSLAHSSISTTPNRIAALELHVAMAISYTTAFPTSDDVDFQHFQARECEDTLNRLSGDRDFRVRKAVSEGLLELTSVAKLSKYTYPTAKMFIRDADSDIRITAIRLLIYYAKLYGMESWEDESMTKKTTISDDAFSAICDAMNDIEIAVRVEAAQKLGDFETVSEDLIYQTLDKKMMRSGANKQVVKVEQSLFALSKKAHTQKDRRWKFAKKAPKQAETRGGWSRGKELNAACPGEEEKKKEENEEKEAESIIPHGACGAFVSALEDEFMDVRKAAVYSLGRLACNRPGFAVSALEYLADMFNDEIAGVRLDAINALTPLIAHGQLNAEQLNVILKCLDDAMPDSRQAMRELLKRAQFTDVNCVEMCVKALLACMKRFPKDKEQVYGCVAEIGRNHAVQVQSIMRSLLDIHLIFHTREPSIEDQDYVGKLIMVLNAASCQPSLVHFMPEFVHRHYRFLRNAFPNIVRAIRVIDEEKQIGRLKKMDAVTNEKAEEVVLNTYQRLCDVASTAHLSDRHIQRDDIFRDSTAISLYNASVSGAARLIFCLGEVSSTVDSVTDTVLRGGELTNVKQLISQSIEDMQSIEHQFSGVSNQILSYLIYCRVYLSFLDMLVWMMQVMAPQSDVIKSGQEICKAARLAIEDHPVISTTLTSFISASESLFFPPVQIPLNQNSNSLEDNKRKIITPISLVNLLNQSMPILPPKFPKVSAIHLKYAKITAPNRDTAVEETLKFYAHLPHGMLLEFELYNMKQTELEAIRVKTTHPDGRCDVMKPRVDEFREESGHFCVSTQLKISCSGPWAEAAEIEVVIGILNGNAFVPLFASPSCFSPAHIRVRIHPHSR
ncbi:hypothetical protein GCK72_003598 [Caenorhabditis remanei]|uniref:Integrator complex subunit 4/Protein SIEL C-terminal Ig-like domain-containing protein n=1 Tax=Caenorhabditis remanei TaxID=31234 RepID=A0A6A5HU73_CAERE|nr:hypothetical protein GCK72_003598 [Caenorhabditis remanei]KAF1771770.1 hypothetical protein GCK72_003598 [Caenorhabditis remanei]